MNFSLDYLLIKELRERLVEKILDEWESKWKLIEDNFPTLHKDDFSPLDGKFDVFLHYLKLDIFNSLKFVITDDSERGKKTTSKPTLRRFLLEKDNLPILQKNTRNILAIYVGYSGWDDFVQDVEPFVRSRYFTITPYTKFKDRSFFGIITTQRFIKTIPKIEGEQEIDNEPEDINYEDITYKKVSTVNYQRFLLLCFLLLSGCACIFFIYKWYENRPFTKEQLAEVKFHFISEYDKPNTSTLKIAYDVSSLGVDSITVDYGYDEFHLSGTTKIIKNENFTETFTKEKDTISHTYFKPNVWSIKLIANGQVVKKLSKTVYSGNEWTSWASGRENRTLWIGKNVSSNVTMKNSILHYDKKDMEKQGGLDYFYTKHQINKDFQIAGDSAALELRVKNSERDGGFTNYDTSISFIDGTQSYTLINLIQDSIEYGNIVIAKTSISGKKKFLPFLDIDLQKWRVVKINLKNKIATFYIDNVKIFQTKYDGNISLIKGIRVTFKGSGSVDWLKLSNSHTNKVVYYDDFSR